MIPFSCADYTFPLLAPAQRFALLHLLGFRYVDIGLFERSAGLSPTLLLADPLGFTEQLKRDLEAAQLQVADLFLQIGADPVVSAVNDPSSLVRDRNRQTFLRALDLCREVGCSHMTGLPGVWHEGVNSVDDLALAIDETAWRQKASFDAGVRYAIEPHMGSICRDIASTRSLLDAVPGLTLSLDYGHFVASGLASEDVHPLLPFASHIHARGGARGRLQTPVSENEIDFEGMIRRLLRSGYKGFLALEYVWIAWNDCNRADNVSETITLRRQLAAFMELDEAKD